MIPLASIVTSDPKSVVRPVAGRCWDWFYNKTNVVFSTFSVARYVKIMVFKPFSASMIVQPMVFPHFRWLGL